MLTRWKRQSAVIQRMVLSLRIDYTRAMNVNIIALSVKTGLLALRHTQLSRCSLYLSVIVLLNVNIFVAVLLSLVYQSNSHSNTVSDCKRRWIAKGKRKQQLIYQQTRHPTSFGIINVAFRFFSQYFCVSFTHWKSISDLYRTADICILLQWYMSIYTIPFNCTHKSTYDRTILLVCYECSAQM